MLSASNVCCAVKICEVFLVNWKPLEALLEKKMLNNFLWNKKENYLRLNGCFTLNLNWSGSE